MVESWCARQELNLRPAGSKGNGHHHSNLIIPTKPKRYEVPVHPVFGGGWGHSSPVHGQDPDRAWKVEAPTGVPFDSQSTQSSFRQSRDRLTQRSEGSNPSLISSE